VFLWAFSATAAAPMSDFVCFLAWHCKSARFHGTNTRQHCQQQITCNSLLHLFFGGFRDVCASSLHASWTELACHVVAGQRSEPQQHHVPGTCLLNMTIINTVGVHCTPTSRWNTLAGGSHTAVNQPNKQSLGLKQHPRLQQRPGSRLAAVRYCRVFLCLPGASPSSS
jgi:hypothetical protein